MNENEDKNINESVEKSNNELNNDSIDTSSNNEQGVSEQEVTNVSEDDISTSSQEPYPTEYQQDDQYKDKIDNVYGNYYETHPKEKKVREKKLKKQNKEKKPRSGKGKKIAKGFGLVAAFVIISFSGGLVGGYLASDKTSSSPTSTKKTINAANVAASEFLSSSNSSSSGTLTIAEAIEKVKPAVVTISTKTIVNNSNSSSSIFGNNNDGSSNSGTTVEEGIGSGFIINKEGYILTNYHVVEGSTQVKVLLSTGKEVGAKVVNYDTKKDIAMVKLDDGVTVPGVAELGDSDALYAGEEVVAIGTPLSTEFSATCTKGIISAINRNVETDSGVTMNLIQTDAAINPGNSGGPLINTKGQVIGINNMKLVTTEVEGIGFAIPINEAADRISTLSKPIITLGITVVEVTDKLAKQNDLPKGLYINDVTDFSAAQKAGIKIGDVITSFDGTKIQTVDDLSQAKAKKSVGDKVKVIVVRNDKEVELEVTLQSN